MIQGTNTIPVPKYGNKSTSAEIKAMVIAYWILRIKRPINTIIRVIEIKVNWALKKPAKAFFKSTNTFFQLECAFSGKNCLKSAVNFLQSLLIKKVANTEKTRTVAAFGIHDIRPGRFKKKLCKKTVAVSVILFPALLILSMIVSCWPLSRL